MILGTFLDRGQLKPFSIDPVETIILKSPETLKRLFLDDCHNDRVASFFGDATKLLPYLPHHRVNDTVLFHLSDTHPIGFNALAHPDMENKLPHTVDAVWPSHIPTVQLDRYITLGAMALIEANQTLFNLPNLYRSHRYRAQVIAKVKTPVIRQALEHYGSRSEREQNDQTSSLQNRYDILNMDKAIGRILSQKRTFKQPGILIVDMPDQKRYDYVAALIMATLKGVAYIQRPLVHVGDTIPVVACDYLDQIPEKLRGRLLGTAVIMATRLGINDAKNLEEHFAVDTGNFNLKDIGEGRALVRTDRTHQIDLMPHTYPAKPSMVRRVTNRSRSQYGTPAKDVDGRIKRIIDGL